MDVTQFNPARLQCSQTQVQGLTTLFPIRFNVLSDSQTRLFFEIELQSNALPTGIFVHSLKFARARITARFAQGVAMFMQEILDDPALGRMR